MYMVLDRRHVLGLLLGALAAPALAETEKEQFSVNWEDRDKVPFQYRPKTVKYETAEQPGTIIIDSNKKFLYLILGDGKARRYGVGVGKDGFRWAGTATIKRKAKWPTWTPTEEQIKRVPNYKQWASGYPGGPYNPLGARALYLFDGDKDTQYRIHGTTEPWSIGKRVSSGCLRMLNVDVVDLYNRVEIGTKVIVK
jgi:lipoprotein-anchoring transpeptidase ErfK/SrfK